MQDDYVATAETLTSLRVGTRVKPTGKLRFNASVDVLNKIQNAVRYTQVILASASGVSCRLFLGPGFRLGACWNRLVETVKTRKKRKKRGENGRDTA